jgi:hypothetical protein
MQTLETILKHKRSFYNDKTLVNCTIAFSFISSLGFNTAQLNTMFEDFDQYADIRLALGIKFGIALSGSE